MERAKESIESQYPNTKVLTYSASVTNTERMTQITKEIGTIDVLVLNAAVLHKPAPIFDIDPEEALESVTVNVLGPLNLIKAFMALPPRTPEAARTIIYTTSAGVQFVMPGTSVYSASKAAMTYLMRCIHEELGSSGIRTFAFHPAFAFTDMAKNTLGLKEDQFTYDSRRFARMLEI